MAAQGIIYFNTALLAHFRTYFLLLPRCLHALEESTLEREPGYLMREGVGVVYCLGSLGLFYLTTRCPPYCGDFRVNRKNLRRVMVIIKLLNTQYMFALIANCWRILSLAT